MFDPARFLDIIRNFTVFSDEPDGLVKRVAKYHQYWAVNAAVESTVEAAGPDGDQADGEAATGFCDACFTGRYPAGVPREPGKWAITRSAGLEEGHS